MTPTYTLFLFLPLSLSLSLSGGTVGFVPENVTVTEGVDNFADVVVQFISPTLISEDVFARLMVLTMDGTALGNHTHLRL